MHFYYNWEEFVSLSAKMLNVGLPDFQFILAPLTLNTYLCGV